MAAASRKTCIELNNVYFSYGDAVVLENISFTINQGDYVGIIGPNGGGKTTLIKILLGLLEPAEGDVLLFGKPVQQAKNRSQIGYVGQHITANAFNFPATVEEVVASGRVAVRGIFRRYNQADKRAIEKAMEAANVADYRKKLISNLSGGQRQRVFIARALAADPKILILDEPTVGIDIAAQERFYSFIEKLNKQMGITVLFVSHDIDVIAKTVTQCLCVNRRLVCHGLPSDIMNAASLEKVYGKKLTFIPHGH